MMPILHFRNWRAAALGALLACLLPAAALAELERGVDYELAADPAPAPAAGQRIRITEFFNLSCPACNAWYPVVEKWLEDKPEDVDWVRQPIAFQRWNGLYARSYFVLESFGRSELIGSFFNALHNERELLNSPERVAEWLADEHDFDEDKALAAFESFGVETKLRRATRQSEGFGINSTPTFLVADRYILSPGLLKSHQRLFGVLDELLEQIRDGDAP